MIDLTKASPADLVCLAHGLTPVLKLTPYMNLAVDEKGVSYKVLSLPDHKGVKRGRFSPKCTNFCGYSLMRPHFTCSCCGWRMLKEGKRKPVEPCTPYILYIMHSRNHRRLKDWLLKKWLSVAEYLANR